MPTLNLPPTAHNGQTKQAVSGAPLATPFQIQVNQINPLRRQLQESEAELARLCRADRQAEIEIFLEGHVALQFELFYAEQRYSDSLRGDELRRQGAEAVAEARGVWGIE